MALCLASWASYCYSEPFTYGVTGNAAAGGLSWAMGPILPAQGGLDINGVSYRYTTVKDPSAPLTVAVSNEDVRGGYIFREVDDWSGLPGNTITKTVRVDNIPGVYWGAGSIETQGEGSVVNASVTYSYRIDECFNPQASPTCDGYIQPQSEARVEFELVSIYEFELGSIYNALEDEAVVLVSEEEPVEYDSEEADVKDEDGDREKRLERALASSESALAMLVPQQAMLDMINAQTNINAYYAANISGGVYPETVTLTDADLPDNKRGLRNNLAQQRLHDKMVEMQYAR